MKIIDGGNLAVAEFEKKFHALLEEHPNISIMAAFTDNTGAEVANIGRCPSPKDASHLIHIMNMAHNMATTPTMKMH